MTVFSDILIAHVSWTVAQTPITHIIFWKTVIKTFRSIYINCFNILSFLLRSAQNCRKCTSLDNLRVITQEGSMGTFSLFWSVKYLNFDQKLPIWTTNHIFLESRQSEVTKNPYFVLSPKGNQKKVSANGLIPVCRGVYIPYFKINPPIFCCPLFSENYLNPQVRVRISIIVNWTPKRLISPVLNLLLNLYIPPWLWKSFKFIVLRLLKIHLWLKKLNLFNFNHASKQNSPPGFYHYPQADRNCPFLPNSIFWGYFFLNRKRGQRIMELKKFTKLTRVLVTSFDGHKSHHLWNLYILGLFCCATI